MLVIGGVAAPGWAAPPGLLSHDTPADGLGPAQPVGPVDVINGGTDLESHSWREFFRQRTQWGVGASAEYYTNILLTRGASRREEVRSEVETQLNFADPRGDWLYGGSYEGQVHRYHVLRQYALHHEFRTYAHYTPLARYHLVFTNVLLEEGQLVRSLAQTDIIRRSQKVIPRLTNTFGFEGVYDVNPTNAARLKYTWDLLEDSAPDRATVDNRIHRIALLMDHDLSRRLTLSGGAVYEDTTFPKASSKNSQRYGAEMGAKYDVDPSTTAGATVDLSQRSVANGDSAFEVDVQLRLARVLSPRTAWSLTFDRKNLPSVGGTTQTFSSDLMAFTIKHALTPRVAMTTGAAHESIQSTTATAHRLKSALGFVWEVRPNVSCTVDYSFQYYAPEAISNHQIQARVIIQL